MTRAITLVLAVAMMAAGSEAAPAVDETVDHRSRMIVVFDHLPVDAWERFAQAGVTRAALFPHARAAAVIGPVRSYRAITEWHEVVDVYPDPELGFHMWQASRDTRVHDVRMGLKPLRSPYTGKGVTVAVADSGIDTSHPDLADKVVANFDFDTASIFHPTTGEPVLRDPVSLPVGVDNQDHGTRIAGIVGGTGEAASGADDMRGVAPDASLVNLMLTSGPVVFESNLLAAYEWIIDHRNDPLFPGGIRVAVSGLGGSEKLKAFGRLLEAVNEAGVAMVFPVGNVDLGNDDVLYPARFPEVIAVGSACKSQDDWSGFCRPSRVGTGSNIGKAVDVVAPGVDVWGPVAPVGRWHGHHPLYPGPVPGEGNSDDELNNRTFYSWSISTSMAAAQVAGIAALIAQADPDITPDRLQTLLKTSARDIGKKGFDEEAGYGLVDALRAVARAERDNRSKRSTDSPKKQTEEGQVLLPSAAPCGTHAYLDALLSTAAGVDNGFSYRFKIERPTQGEPFVLNATDPLSDLDLVFRGGQNGVFDRRGFGGEAGMVPAGATRATVCIFSGAGSRFTYAAG